MKPALNLTIKRCWLVMIATGKKREEYRDWRNAQVSRFYSRCFRHGFPQHGVAVFRAGYRMDSPAVAVELTGMTLRGAARKALHPEWGEPRKPAHFVLSLGKVLKIGDYITVKAWLGSRNSAEVCGTCAR